MEKDWRLAQRLDKGILCLQANDEKNTNNGMGDVWYLSSQVSQPADIVNNCSMSRWCNFGSVIAISKTWSCPQHVRHCSTRVCCVCVWKAACDLLIIALCVFWYSGNCLIDLCDWVLDAMKVPFLIMCHIHGHTVCLTSSGNNSHWWVHLLLPVSLCGIFPCWDLLGLTFLLTFTCLS